MTQQPEWKLVYATDYSALYVDTTGVYDPELMIAHTDDDAGVAYVYRFPLERCWQVTDEDGSTFLTDTDPVSKNLPYPLTTYVPWYRDSLGDVADSCSMETAELVELLCSDDPSALAEAFEAIGGYHGFDNFDSYPEEWTLHAFESWPDRGPDAPEPDPCTCPLVWSGHGEPTPDLKRVDTSCPVHGNNE